MVSVPSGAWTPSIIAPAQPTNMTKSPSSESCNHSSSSPTIINTAVSVSTTSSHCISNNPLAWCLPVSSAVTPTASLSPIPSGPLSSQRWSQLSGMGKPAPNATHLARPVTDSYDEPWDARHIRFVSEISG
ncbi:unnamed protein product [Protopolystoma xenopodis]|uniref:Uncharacterized protein n=1 Tax=Protopolystoma xenopodis TaxID=117903 RepID=A0A3S5CV82_9PLAT|nr:unnamed protein product [Protopolystoma xenopodis]